MKDHIFTIIIKGERKNSRIAVVGSNFFYHFHPHKHSKQSFLRLSECVRRRERAQLSKSDQPRQKTETLKNGMHEFTSKGNEPTFYRVGSGENIMKKVAFDVFYLFISSFDCGGGSGCSAQYYWLYSDYNVKPRQNKFPVLIYRKSELNTSHEILLIFQVE